MGKAIAGEANCHFEYVSASSVESPYIGQGAAKIRTLFKDSKNRDKPTIIFFDEFDSIGSKRTLSDNSHSKQTLNQLLTELDGFQSNPKVIVLASTNFPQSLDPAVVRPGRFDKSVSIPLPSRSSRIEISKYYLNKVKPSNEIQPEIIARLTIGMSGADIKNLINIAALKAAQESHSVITMDDIEYASDRLSVGIINKSIIPTKDEHYRTAVHEGGHALISLLTPAAEPMSKVTILSKGGALGYIN